MASWVRGQSGNPKGRAVGASGVHRRSPAEVRLSHARVHRCLQRLGGKDGHKWAEALHAIAMDTGTEVNARIKAINSLLPYLWGRPLDQLEVSGTVGASVRVTHEYHDPVHGVITAERVDRLALMGGPVPDRSEPNELNKRKWAAETTERELTEKPTWEKPVGEDE